MIFRKDIISTFEKYFTNFSEKLVMIHRKVGQK